MGLDRATLLVQQRVWKVGSGNENWGRRVVVVCFRVMGVVRVIQMVGERMESLNHTSQRLKGAAMDE